MKDKVNQLLALRTELLAIAIKQGPEDKQVLQDLYSAIGDVVKIYDQATKNYNDKEFEFKVLENKYNELNKW